MKPEFDELQLGDDATPVEVETSLEVLQASLALVSQARKTVEIVSRHLDPAVYDNAEFCRAMRRFCLGSRRARVRIIIIDSRPTVGRGHQLIELAQRLSTFVEIRKPGRDHANYNSAFLIADRVGSLHRMLADRFEGRVNFNDPRTAQGLSEQFESMWNSATPDPNVRRLSL